MVIYSPLGFSEAVKTVVSAIHAVYLPESENIIEPKGIESSRKIQETIKIQKLERKVDPIVNTYINFYKIADDEERFHVQWYGGEEKVATKKVVTMTINAQNVMDSIKKVKSGYVVQCAKIGITKNVSTNDNCFIFFINFA